MAAFSDREPEQDMHQIPRMDDISEHIRHVFADLIEDDIPDRFALLLTRLREMDEEKGPEDGS